MNREDNTGDYIFETTDPEDRVVALKSGTWNYHITGGDHARKELIGEEETIQEIIESPSFIVKSSENENRELYYDLAYLSSMRKIKPVKVIVERTNDIGDICTVMVESRMHGTFDEGDVIYDRHKK